jgi:hypothetical protein
MELIELRLSPLVPRTAIRIPHSLNVDRSVRLNVPRPINCIRLRIANVACSVGAGPPDGVIALFPAFNIEFFLRHFPNS